MANETATPTPAPAAPAAPAPAPAASAPKPAPKMEYGRVPREAVKELFAKIDAEAEGTPAPGATPAPPAPAEPKKPEPKEAEPKEKAEAEGEPTEPTPAETAALEEQLPASFRQALKAITDPKVRRRIAEDHFVLRKWSRLQNKLGGLSVDDIDSYVSTAVGIAPTPEVLQELSETATMAHKFASDFTENGPDGFGRFAGGLIQANPQAFVNFVGFLLNNDRLITQGLHENVDPALARQFKKTRDDWMNRNNRNLIGNLRKEGQKDGREVLAEVADELEKFLGFDKKPAGPSAEGPAPDAPQDPRDVELARLRREREQARAQRIEHFTDSVFNIAGTSLEKEMNAWMNAKAAGIGPKGREKLAELTAQELYDYLLGNPHIKARVARLNAQGRLDRQHHEALIRFYVEQGKRYFPIVASRKLAELRELAEPAAQQHRDRVERNVQRREVGSGGAVSGTRRVDLKGAKNAKEMFEALDQIAEG